MSSSKPSGRKGEATSARTLDDDIVRKRDGRRLLRCSAMGRGNGAAERHGSGATGSEDAALSHFERNAHRYAAWTRTSRGFRERGDTFGALIDRLWPNGGQGAICLDLGCGNGALAVLAAEHGFQVTALDGSAEMVALAQQRSGDDGASVQYRQERLPLGEEVVGEFADQVDLVISSSVVEYLTDAEADHLFAQCGRLLSRRGKALMSFPNDRALYWRLERRIKADGMLRGRDASVQKRSWNPVEVAQAARRHGLTTTETQYFALPLQERVPAAITARPSWLATLFVSVLTPTAELNSPR
jgi:2-polyprenyl-3-methyl-5-hydroxy-6-metoxy-1,4-benzoquinol methylase